MKLLSLFEKHCVHFPVISLSDLADVKKWTQDVFIILGFAAKALSCQSVPEDQLNYEKPGCLCFGYHFCLEAHTSEIVVQSY